MLVAKAPFRVSLFGGGTDFPSWFQRHRGTAISMGIDKYIWCMVHGRQDGLLYLGYSANEIVACIEDIKHDIVRACLSRYREEFAGTTGLELKWVADLPDRGGSGLGGSSTFTVATLQALSAAFRSPMSLPSLALEACKVEIQDCGKEIGVQDQQAATYGGIHHYTFSGQEVRVEPLFDGDVPRDFLNQFLLFDLSGNRSVDPLLEQEARNKSGKNDETLHRIVRLADEALLGLRKEDWEYVGKLLDESWQEKRNLSSTVANRKIDSMYMRARSAGAWGGKICGAGDTGFMLVMAPVERQADVMSEMFEDGYELVPLQIGEGARVVYSE